MDDVDELEGTEANNSMFSKNATENAEVVPPRDRRGGDGLWTVSANRTTSDSVDQPASEPFAASLSDEDPSMPPIPPPPFGRPYRSPMSSARPPQAETLSEDDLWTQTDRDFTDGNSTGAFAVSDPSWTSEQTSEGSQDPPGSEPSWSETDDDPVEESGTPNADFGGFDESSTYADAHRGGATHDSESTSWRSDSDVHDSVGSVFRADPVQRDDDVIDYFDDVIDQDPPVDHSGRPLFASGDPSGSQSVFGVTEPRTAPEEPNLWRKNRGGDQARSSRFGEAPLEGDYDEESPGFTAAIARLSIDERERATIPLLVAGGRLEEGEQVLGLLVGQMLGRPAVMVLTPNRVMVVNDRRWQPVVDLYALDSRVEVRGRHDRNVAAVGVSDGDALSMVDGIFDVEGAMEMVSRIRSLTEEGD